jgi:tetratricopeptide (TPR) repeat protein
MRSLRKLFFCPFLLIAILSNPAPSLADANKIFNENNRSVVVIVALDKQGNPVGQGSGFVVRSDGAIITNYHVISGAEDIQVKAGKEVLPVEGIIYIDKENDLVILKAKAKALPAVRLGDIAKVSVGEKVYVIGSPQGLENTISDGILSGIREVDPKRKIIQITAPVSAGSSGGPVFNDNGEVIGVVTFLIKESQNLNFAMPINVLKSRIADKKVTSFQKAQIGEYQKTAEYWYNLGAFCDESGLYNKAIEAYKQAIRIKPDLAEAYNNLGAAYGNLGRHTEAVEACKQAIRIKPDDAEAHYNLGKAYGDLGKYAEAMESFKQAIRIKLDFAGAHYNLGVAYLILGRKSDALEEYKILKELDKEKANKLFDLIYR